MCFFTTVIASHDNKESAKIKRAYGLAYSYPYGPYSHFYDHAFHHDTIAHAPTLLHHTSVHHAAPIISAPLITPSKTSVVTTNIHHAVHDPFVVAHPAAAPLISSAYVETHHPIIAAASPLYTEFHRRR